MNTILDGSDIRTTIVVPCYNEELRLERDKFLYLARSNNVYLLFVDDGSTDRTGHILDQLEGTSDHIDAIRLPANTGKAEAVRRGMLQAIDAGASVVGYYDADASTPPDELLRLVNIMMMHPQVDVILGSRVAMLGRSIERTAVRHYLGRIYATVASSVLGIQVYDTQCGAKLFRSNENLKAALKRPFSSSWSFDVRLLDRLLRGNGAVRGIPEAAFLEVPLECWEGRAGSKLGASGAFVAALDLLYIAIERRRVRHRDLAEPGEGCAHG